VSGSGSAIDDMNRIAADFNAFINHFTAMSPEILTQAYQPTFEKSQAYCPKKTGDLVSSGFMEVAGAGTKTPTVVIGYGRGGRPDYAPIVHEDTTKFHAPPTRSKWLQAALDEDYNQILQRITLFSRQAAGMV
jgi:hypothetical protein